MSSHKGHEVSVNKGDVQRGILLYVCNVILLYLSILFFFGKQMKANNFKIIIAIYETVFNKCLKF